MILKRHYDTIFFSNFYSFLKTFFHIVIPVEPSGIRILSHESVKAITMDKIISAYPLVNGNTLPCSKQTNNFCSHIFSQFSSLAYHQKLALAVLRDWA